MSILTTLQSTGVPAQSVANPRDSSVFNLQYKVGIKRQITTALRKTISSPLYPDPDLASRINVELEYPIIQEVYPAIYIVYHERRVYASGLDNYEISLGPDGPMRLRQWFFEGNVLLNIMALDPLERDYISASVINMLAFGREDPVSRIFRDEIYDEDWVSLQLMTENPQPIGEITSPSPWSNKDEFVYIAGYSLPLFGSFFSDPGTQQLVTIKHINTFAYSNQSTVPQGSTNPLDQSIPWM